MKKILSLITILILLPFNVLATNTYTTNLEPGNSSSWTIADGSQTGLDFTGDFTFEAWINCNGNSCDIDTNDSIMLGKWGSGCGFRFDITSIGKLQIIYKNAAQVATISSTDSAQISVPSSTWYHVAVACDVSVPSCSFYVNGSPVASSMDSSGATDVCDNGTAIAVGQLGQFAQNFFEDYIDDVRIWGVVRTDQQIADNYNCSLAGDEDDLIAYWPFDNNGLDATSNDNDLTNNNSATFQSGSLPFTATCGAVPAEEKLISTVMEY